MVCKVECLEKTPAECIACLKEETCAKCHIIEVIVDLITRIEALENP